MRALAPFAALLALLPAPARAALHPLDALTAAEIDRAVEVLRAAGKADPATRFPEVALLEPAKTAVLAWRPADPVPRRALLVVLDRAANARAEAVVDLAAGRLESWRAIEAGQPPILMEEYELAGDAVRSDPRWRAAMARRGIEGERLEQVYLDVWAAGEMEAEGAGGARLARVLSFDRGTQTHPYGPPVEGVVAVVDLNTWRVLEVLDHGLAPLSRESTDVYDPAVTGPPRPALPPLVTTQPGGPGFALEGGALRWERWRLRWSMRPREGLTLHQVEWDDGQRARPILYRASLAEMLVPYGDPSPGWSWRGAFDQGEYGLGRLAHQLEAGTTVPAHATLLDAVFAGDDGRPYTHPGAVAVYERDGGPLWLHYDLEHRTAARRARELVLGFVTTIGNYDYDCRWVLRQDGAIGFELGLSGSLLTKGVASTRCEVCATGAAPAGRGEVEPAGAQRHGTLVAPGVLAPNHQHFVSLRLDLDVDGTANAVKEVEARADRAGRRNPRGNAFLAVSRYLRSERAAVRDASPATHRVWEVYNPGSTGRLGHPAAYALVPGATAPVLLARGSPLRRLGAFAEHAFHATRYRDDELHAAGPYPGQNRTPGGLALWTRGDEPLDGQDVVVWHTIGVTHLPRPEEHPIMNLTEVGFRLEPVGFFDRNPALDVPRP